jgi:hypothetical protein
MFIRFAVPDVEPLHTGDPSGVFAAWYALRDSDRVPDHQLEPLREAFAWFNNHLPIPPRGANIPSDAIFWFRAEHAVMTRQIWSVVTGLRLSGCEVQLLRTTWPGRIAYQDEYQIAARVCREGSAPRVTRLLSLRTNC